MTPEFESLLKITDVLVEVIALYRPGRSGGWTGEWREIQCPDGLAGETLRLFYHAVCILSHRNLAWSASTITTPVSAASSLLPSSSAPSRLASARAILCIASNSHRRWLPLPIVPYSVSLALTVFYAETLRISDRSEFLDTCEVLEDMSRVWWFAGTMARMGRQAVERVKVAEAAGVLAELGGAEPSSSSSSNTAPPSVSGTTDHLHWRRGHKNPPSASKNGILTSSAVGIDKADSTTSLELQENRDSASFENNNPRHHHHKHIPTSLSQLQTLPQPQPSLPSSLSSVPSTLSSPVPDGILQLSSTSTSASISTSAATLTIAIDAATQPAPPSFPTAPILEEEDEWFLQLFPDLALPTSFPLGWTDEGEDGGLGLE